MLEFRSHIPDPWFTMCDQATPLLQDTNPNSEESYYFIIFAHEIYPATLRFFLFFSGFMEQLELWYIKRKIKKQRLF